jgi:hypothetical protein
MGENYTDKEGQVYKIRLSTYDELVKYAEESPNKFKITRFGDVINLMGVSG